MRNTKTQAFTLVELIVVITILAILGTIAFISLQGYSADARNSKRTSDLGNIQSAISLKQVEGVPLMSFVNDTISKEVTAANFSLGGAALGGVAADAYNAGTPAYTVLNVVEKDFKDPQESEYGLGATTLAGGTFQIAASIEVDGNDEALVAGTFNARGTTGVEVSSKDTNTITLIDSAANSFKKGDLVTLSLGGASEITKVSRDGVTLTMSVVGTGTGTIALSIAETAGLIADKTDATVPVVDGSGATLAY